MPEEQTEVEGPSDEVVPEELSFKALPDQTMYKFDMWESKHRELGVADYFFHTLVLTKDFRINITRGEPGEVIGWHTHTPENEQVNLILEGELKVTLLKENGDYQVVVAGPGEMVYIPGGARHNWEVTSDEEMVSLNIFSPSEVARLESLKADDDLSPYPRLKDLPVSLWVDRQVNEVIKKDDDIVTEGEIVEAND